MTKQPKRLKNSAYVTIGHFPEGHHALNFEALLDRIDEMQDTPNAGAFVGNHEPEFTREIEPEVRDYIAGVIRPMRRVREDKN
jgi:hypothetical protein